MRAVRVDVVGRGVIGVGGAAATATVNGEDERANARRRRLMETREDPVYGDGFRAAKRGLDACGGNLAKFLEHVRRHGELPR